MSEKPASKHWYESLQMRGYTQVRYNRLGETNPNLKCEQCDRYWGNNQGVGIRRARLIISGQVHPRVYLYFQTDAANTVGTGMQYLQVRDLYFDYGLDKKMNSASVSGRVKYLSVSKTCKAVKTVCP